MKTTIRRHFFALCTSTLYVLTAGHPVLAEDTEVLLGPGGQAGAIPNVLFIMDTSGSMNRGTAGERSPAAGQSRMEIVQNVLADLMANNSDINVALMRFNANGTGGHFVAPMQMLNDDTRADIIDMSSNLVAIPNTNTPLAETLYEAALFWSGLTVDYGDDSPAPNANVSGVSDRGNYISPITSQCQRNYTILLTDGMPDADNEADEKISGQFLNDEICTGSCLDEIAGYLSTVDQSTGSNGIPGTQTVETYTIGFALTGPEDVQADTLPNPAEILLRQTATAGDGAYFPANDAAQLSVAFADILEAITNANSSFSPPALAVNTFNGISHLNRLYYALFEPAAAPGWTGNIKPYSLNNNYELTDANNSVAVDERGLFLATSRSFWSSDIDGGNIVTGAANDRLPDARARRLYTYTGDYDTQPPGNFALGALLDNNDELTADMLGIDITNNDGITDPARTNAEFTRVLNTIRNAPLGAPLHSQPALVTYGGTNTTDADLTLFVATNNGFLHALNASPNPDIENTIGGRELFAFIPKELLPNLTRLDDNTGPVAYGLDGDISVWVKESTTDSDNNIETGGDDHVYVYVGMRRGGNNYYALDVTDREAAPILKWVIRGGSGGTPGFEELGQSWSKPVLTSIPYGSSVRKVLIFGGGYDTEQDKNPLNTNDNIGRAIFIVDADTGERLWSAGPAGSNANLEFPLLTNSIPSEVRLFDSDHDGYTDRLYVGDMRGQIFRFDLQANASGMTGTGMRLANLGGSTEADNRRFYYPPDVVLTQSRGVVPYISINIGSGYRAHPLNHLNADGDDELRVNDRFYSLRDHNVVGPIPQNERISLITDGRNGNLSNLTNRLITDNDTVSTSGWYITLGAGSGEKVLAPSITINGEIIFTTYTPPEQTETSACEPPTGTGRLYRVSLFDATPTRAVTETGDSEPTPTLEDRYTAIGRPGIPSGPIVVFRENDDTEQVELLLCVDTKCEKPPETNPIQKTYWRQN